MLTRDMLKKWMYLVLVGGLLFSAKPSLAVSCGMWMKSEHHNMHFKVSESIFDLGSSIKTLIDKEFRKHHTPMYYQCGVSDYLYQMFDAHNLTYQNGKKFEWHVRKTLKGDDQRTILHKVYTCAFQCFDGSQE